MLGTMVFTVFSAHSHFVQTLFFQSFPFKFASKFRLFFALFFIEKIEKIGSKISSEPDFAVGSTFCSILAHFFRFLVNFGGFWEAWGGWWAAFLEFLGLQKREQNLRGFWGAFLRTPWLGRRATRWRLRLEKPLGMVGRHGMEWWGAGGGSSTPWPRGRADCLRFANPAEADWGLEARKLEV